MTHAKRSDGVPATHVAARGGAPSSTADKTAPARPTCSVCVRSDVAGINEALVAGRSASAVALAFYGNRNSKDSLVRHSRKCLGLGDAAEARRRRKASSRRLERALNAVQVEPVTLGTPTDVLRQHERRYASASEIFEEARVARDNRLAIAADELRGKILNDATRLQGFEKSASPLVAIDARTIRIDPSVSSEFLREYVRAVRAGDPVPELPAAAIMIEGAA